ncbi:MAG: hypothetical protein AB7H77_06815 [Bdellovibrionales bacterium]
MQDAKSNYNSLKLTNLAMSQVDPSEVASGQNVRICSDTGEHITNHGTYEDPYRTERRVVGITTSGEKQTGWIAEEEAHSTYHPGTTTKTTDAADMNGGSDSLTYQSERKWGSSGASLNVTASSDPGRAQQIRDEVNNRCFPPTPMS